MYYKSLLTILICSIALGVFGQKSFQDLAELKDKKFAKKVNTYNTIGFVTQYEKILQSKDIAYDADYKPDLKKVGLVCFFLVDQNVIDAGAKGWSYDNLTLAGSKSFVQEFYDRSLPVLIDHFQKAGISLLTPDQFLDSPEKKEAYANAEIEISKLSKIAGKLTSFFTKTSNTSGATPPGYELYPELLASAGGDMKAVDGAGELTEALGLDAILTVQIKVRLEGKKLHFVGTTMAMHTYNPLPEDPNKNWIGKYYQGYLLSGINMELDKPFEFAQLKKKSLKYAEYAGYPEFFARLMPMLIEGALTAFDEGSKGNARRRGR